MHFRPLWIALLAGTLASLPALAAQTTTVSNFSLLVQIPAGAGGTTPPLGLVVSGPSVLTCLIRAVGPSLKVFGLTNLAAAPHVHVYDAAGNEPGLAFGTTGFGPNWPATFALAGAFPLQASGDAYFIQPLAAGAYTVQVTDDANLGGRVLLEVYQGITVVSPPVTIEPVSPVVTPVGLPG